MSATAATKRALARTHVFLGYHGTAQIEELGQTSPGGYHLHYLNERDDDETVIWLDPAGALITGVALGAGEGQQNDVAAILNALEAIGEIEGVLRRELKARLGA